MEHYGQHGSCSAVLGGSGNNDGGFGFVGIYGQNVTGVMQNAFHVNELVIQDVPVVTTPLGWSLLAPGQVYTSTLPGTNLYASPLYVK